MTPTTGRGEAGPNGTGPGFVVGLAAEAHLLRNTGRPVAIGGGTAQGAARAAAALAPHVTALISFGLAGGLDPTLAPGTIVIPGRVIDATETWLTDPALNDRLGGATGHTLLGGGSLLATVAEKAAARTTGAHAVDLESAAVARVAADHALPFAVLRAICDEATRPLPHAARVALDGAGRIGLWRVALAAIAHPAELPALIGLARDAGQARAALAARLTCRPALHRAP